MKERPRPRLSVRDMRREDLDRVFEIESRAYPTPWSRAMLEAELGHDWSTSLLAVEAKARREIVGFAIFWTIVDEVHVLDIAVDPEAQGRGVGSFLVDSMLTRARQDGARLASLEVRRSNLGAQSLYASKGFRQVGIRPRYYAENGEDAIIMELGL